MAGTYSNGLPYKELIEGDCGEFDENGGTAVRKIRIYSDVMLDYLNVWMGSHPILPMLKCKRWTYDPAPSTKSNTYVPGPDEMIVTAYYAPVWEDDESANINIDASVDVLEVGGGRKWSDGTTAVDQKVHKRIPSGKISIEKTGYGTLPLGEIMGMLGKVNDSTWHEFDAGKVLLTSASSRAQWDFENMTWRHRIAYEFLAKTEQTHNQIWRKDTGEWDTLDGDLYESADFSVLGV